MGGFALPGVAAALRPALPWLVTGLIFVSALRIGLRAAAGNLAEALPSLRAVLILQLALPLAGIGVLAAAGLLATPAGLTIALLLSAPSISGSPAFTAMLGRDPAPAMRLLILGTALVPLTALPTFWLLPALGGFAEVAMAALRLSGAILLATAAAFGLRRWLFPDPAPDTIAVMDGVANIALGVMVIGLMAAAGPALRSDPAQLLFWLALVFAVNFGLQFGARLLGARVGTCIVAGNRNIALFLVALPPEVTDPLLLFIGCYQVPMFLTPILLRRLYAPR